MLVTFTTKHASSGLVTFVTHKGFAVLFFLPSCCVNSLVGWFSNRTGTSVDDGKARGKDETLLPVPNLQLCYWSSQSFDLRAPSSTDVLVLLLNQPDLYLPSKGDGRSPGYQGTLSKEVFERRTPTGREAFSHLTCLNASYLNCTAKCSFSCKEDLPK